MCTTIPWEQHVLVPTPRIAYYFCDHLGIHLGVYFPTVELPETNYNRMTIHHEIQPSVHFRSQFIMKFFKF